MLTLALYVVGKFGSVNVETLHSCMLFVTRESWQAISYF